MRSWMCSLMQMFPRGIPPPGHSFLKSATQCLIANFSCAVAFDDHNIKMAPIIRMIFTTKVLPLGTAAIGTRRGSWTPTRKHL